MAKSWACATLLAVLLVAGSVEAITAGPGGRIYMTERYTSSGTSYVKLRSLVVDQNWNPVVAPGNWDVHQVGGLDLMDNYTYGVHAASGISPEIYTYGGDGYGQLVMGLFYNNDPVTTVAGTPKPQTMDALKIAPSAGAASVTLLGTGAAHPMGYGWYAGMKPMQYASTDRGWMVMPDPEGGFVGDGVNNFIVTQRGPYDIMSINTDANSDGNITDDCATDYTIWK